MTIKEVEVIFYPATNERQKGQEGRSFSLKEDREDKLLLKDEGAF